MTDEEKAARAICNALGLNPDDWSEENGVRVYKWQLELDCVRAALTAIDYPAKLERIRVLEEALKPFAAWATQIVKLQHDDSVWMICGNNNEIEITYRDLRRARAALATGDER